MVRIHSLFVGAITLLGFSISASASAIIVNNSDFDVLPAGGLNYASPQGAYSIGAIDGWTETGSGLMGQYQPVGTFNTLPESTVAFSSGGIISQEVGAVEAGATYVFSVDIGHRLDKADTGSANLLINGVTYSAVGTPAAAGDWSTYTVTYDALPSDVGALIYLQLVSSGPQADFADVQFGDPVPEPAPATLMAACLAGLLVYRRRVRPVR